MQCSKTKHKATCFDALMLCLHHHHLNQTLQAKRQIFDAAIQELASRFLNSFRNVCVVLDFYSLISSWFRNMWVLWGEKRVMVGYLVNSSRSQSSQCRVMQLSLRIQWRLMLRMNYYNPTNGFSLTMSENQERWSLLGQGGQSLCNICQSLGENLVKFHLETDFLLKIETNVL